MGWGSSTRRGGGRKVRASLESLSSLGSEERNLRCLAKFAGVSRTRGGVQENCAKKLCAHYSFPRDDSPQLSGGDAPLKLLCSGEENTCTAQTQIRFPGFHGWKLRCLKILTYVATTFPPI